jgi:hemerythrin
MTDKKLSKLLEQLHEELGKTDAVDEKGRELLRHLNADIQKLLERTEGTQTDESVLQRLQDAIDHFEVEHPAITAALSQMLNTLSNAGI